MISFIFKYIHVCVRTPITWSINDHSHTWWTNTNINTNALKLDHNRLHAADVLHAVYYLTSQPIDDFCQVPLDLIDHYDDLLNSTKRNYTPTTAANLLRAVSSSSNNGTSDLNQQHQHLLQDEEFVATLTNHVVAVVVAAAAAASDSESPFGIMGANLTALEVMALYTAAAMHDYNHPGRTNSFLVATSSPLALLYNDRSVLENHHAAAAWALFYSEKNFNWLQNLDKDEVGLLICFIICLLYLASPFLLCSSSTISWLVMRVEWLTGWLADWPDLIMAARWPSRWASHSTLDTPINSV